MVSKMLLCSHNNASLELSTHLPSLRNSFKLTNLCKNLRIEEALDIMDQRCISISPSDAFLILEKCIKKKDIKFGRKIQSLVIENDLDLVIILADHFIRLYATCGCLIEAKKVFIKVLQPSLCMLIAIVTAYINIGQAEAALHFYNSLQLSGIKSNNFIYFAVLRACASLSSIVQGRKIHEQITHSGLQSDAFLGSALLDMYAKCGSLGEARKVFDNLSNRDVVCWNAMITGYGQCGEGRLALECFHEMRQEAMSPSRVTFLGALKACGSIVDIEQGRQIHEQIVEYRFHLDIVVGNTLVDMYAKCGSLTEAQMTFDRLPDKNVVSWTALITGYAKQGEGHIAIECLYKMQQQNLKANELTFSIILNACGSLEDLYLGRKIHEHIVGNGFEFNTGVGNALIDMYAKCSSLEEACIVFDKLPSRDVISWGSMIAGFAQHDEGLYALQFFEGMQCWLKANKIIFLSILKACGIIGALDQGRRIHEEILESKLRLDIIVGNALIDMYAKCGSMNEACGVFNSLSDRDVISWGAMVAGYAQLGHLDSAVVYYEEMQCCGIKPDDLTFTAILTACSHVGLVDEGWWYFTVSKNCIGIIPNESHCNCMIDLLSHAACFKEAEVQATLQQNLRGWMTLLSACKMHGNIQLGRQCFKEIVCLDSSFSPGYVLMSNVYATSDGKQY